MLKRLYYEMLRIRRAEERICELYKEGYIKAPVHLSIGQEAVAAGIMSELTRGDKITSTHRCHGHYLAKGGSLKKMFAELLGKATGCCGGKGGTMHLFDDEAGHVISAPIVGGSIALATGIGLSLKIKGSQNVAVTFFGDGAVEEGIFWESINFASINKLPVVFVCENNLYATHSHILKRQPDKTICPRIEPHGVKTFYVEDGNDVLSVSEATLRAVELARTGQPCFIEANTYRWKEHWGVGDDWHLGYRTKAEVDIWMDNCPLKKCEGFFSDPAEIEEMEGRIRAELDSAVEFAMNSAPPDSSEIIMDVEGRELPPPDDNFASVHNLNYKEAAAEALLQAMEADERVILMGEGVDNITGVYGQVLPAYKKFGPTRVIDTPLSENGLTGIAIGAALDGLHPVLIHQRNDFMLLTMDQMFNHAVKLRYASGGRHKVPLTILSFIARKPGEGVQHSQSLQSVFAHFPGIKVGMPASPSDVKGMLLSAIRDEDPVIILEHRSVFDLCEAVPANPFFTPHTAKVVKEGSDVTIVAISAAVETVKEAVAELNAQYPEYARRVSAEIIDLRWIRPYDFNLIAKSVMKTGRLLVVDTGWKSFGVSSEIISAVSENCFAYLRKAPIGLGMTQAPCPASHFLEKDYHPSKAQIISILLELYENRTR